MKGAAVTKVLQSRGALAVAIMVMIVASVYALNQGVVSSFRENSGLVFPSANEWIGSSSGNLWLSVIAELFVVAMMIYINKVFSIPKTITLSYAVFFAAMQTATPEISCRLYSGTVLCVIVALSILLMFSSFGQYSARRRVFLVFFMLSAAATTQYAFLIYIPVFFVACAQMRILSLQTVLAALLGVITPWWILLGFGIVSLVDIHFPQNFSALAGLEQNDRVAIMVTAGFTAIVGLSAYVLSWLKLMTYNAATRSCNGLLALTTFVTMIAMAVDYSNMSTYMPLLNFCAAFMLGHVFVIRNSSRAWIWYVSIVIMYYVIYLWRIYV